MNYIHQNIYAIVGLWVIVGSLLLGVFSHAILCVDHAKSKEWAKVGISLAKSVGYGLWLLLLICCAYMSSGV